MLCDALGLEFYIGPPREGEIPRDINLQADDLTSPERELIHETRMLCEEVLKRLEMLSRDRSAQMHSGALVANQVSGEDGYKVDEDRLLLAIECAEESGVAVLAAPADKARLIIKAYRYIEDREEVETEPVDKGRVLAFCKSVD